MTDFWWKLTGKLAVNSTIKGFQLRGFSNEDIKMMIEEKQKPFNLWDDRQKKYAEEILNKDNEKYLEVD